LERSVEAPQISTLYAGEVRVEFHPKGHRYIIYDREEPVPDVPSVTSIVGTIDKSGPLIGWAVKNVLTCCKGAILPGVEYSEIYLSQVWENARKSFREVKEEAAEVGIEVHQFLEDHFRGLEPVLPSEGSQTRAAVDGAIKWLRDHEIRPVEVERRIYSRRHKYSGTLDKLALVDGELSLVDWKTGKDIYPEYWFQTAAYQAAFEEETGEKIRRRIIVRLDKETGDFDPRVRGRSKTRADFGAFLGALKIHKRLREMKNEGI